MIKRSVLVLSLAIVTIIVIVAVSSVNNARADTNPSFSAGNFTKGQTCHVLVGVGVITFQVDAIGQGKMAGLVLVEAVSDAKFVGIDRGSVYWLNPSQVLLIRFDAPPK